MNPSPETLAARALPNRRDMLALSAAVAGFATATWARGASEEATWTDPARSRQIPVLVRWPDPNLPVPPGGRPLVIYSHGLGGTRDGGSRWGEAWAGAGLVVLHLQHPGSDLEAVRGAGGLRQALRPRELVERMADVNFALDEVKRLAAGGADRRWSAVRTERVGMAGHSFGALTTFAVAGQRYGRGNLGGRMDESQVAAFIALSPNPPQGDARTALAGVTRPMLCITGTEDGDVVGTKVTPEHRASVYEALPAGRKALLVLKDADHMTFAGNWRGGRSPLQRPPAAVQREPAHHELVAAITTDWWRGWLLGDTTARGRLAQPQGLTPADVWKLG